MKTTVTVTKDVWEDLTKLKLQWKNPTLSEVIRKLLEDNEISSHNTPKTQINTIQEEG